MTDTAALIGRPYGTLAAWRHRGHAPAGGCGKYTLADVMSLTLADDLVKMGVLIEHAAAIGYAVKDRWQKVVLDSPRRTFLLARLGDDGKWLLATCLQHEIPLPARDATFQVDLHAVAKRVMERLREVRGG